MWDSVRRLLRSYLRYRKRLSREDFEWRELWPDVLFVVLGFFGALAAITTAVKTGWWGLHVVGVPALVFFGILLFSLPGTPTGN